MRLLLSSHGASPYGAERVLLAMAERLAARGHEVTVEFPHQGPAVELAYGIHGVDVWVSERPRLPRNGAELLRYMAGAPAAYRALVRRMRRDQYDVVWVHSIYNPIAALAAKRAGVPVVWHIHERNLPLPAGWFLDRFIRHTCDRAVVISGFVRRSYPACADRVVVIPNALLRGLSPMEPKRGGPFTALYIGQFEPRKRVPDVVAAIAKVPECRLVLVGGGKAARRVESAVQQAGVGARVEFAGVQDDVAPYLAQCDCVVIPSRNEPFGLVALEAMAAGRPVIAADSGALPEVLGDAALYYPLGDTAALADQIGRLARDPGCAESLRVRGLERIRHFSLDRMIDAVEAQAAGVCRAATPRTVPASGARRAAELGGLGRVAAPVERSLLTGSDPKEAS